uniref:Uncharacterized protein n=1 Tax=Rhizophora mucronata TaxID=61149 RepID=A0A2P2IL47_RHIMU
MTALFITHFFEENSLYSLHILTNMLLLACGMIFLLILVSFVILFCFLK